MHLERTLLPSYSVQAMEPALPLAEGVQPVMTRLIGEAGDWSCFNVASRSAEPPGAYNAKSRPRSSSTFLALHDTLSSLTSWGAAESMRLSTWCESRSHSGAEQVGGPVGIASAAHTQECDAFTQERFRKRSQRANLSLMSCSLCLFFNLRASDGTGRMVTRCKGSALLLRLKPWAPSMGP